MHKFLLNVKNHMKAYENQPINQGIAQYLCHLTTIYTELMACEGLKNLDVEKFELELKEKKNKESENEIDHEFKIANDYYNYYLKTKDKDYLQMVKDRLSHAHKFITERKEVAKTDEDKKYLESKLNEYNDFIKKLEMWQ